MMNNILTIAILFLGLNLWGQCANPTTMMFEDFEGGNPIPGAITANIYGGGSHNNGAYVISGANHGWFNVVNGVGDVDVYDQQVNGFCQDSVVDVSFWTRHSYGTTNVTYSVIDDLGAVLATATLNLSNVYQQVNFNFLATTPGLRFVIHCNSTGGNGVDIIVEDILITQCNNGITENTVYADCTMPSPVDLFSLFTSAIPPGGTWNGPSVLTNGSLGTFDPLVNTPGTYSYTHPITCAALVSTVDVNLVGNIDLGPDTVLCNGANVTLDAGPGFSIYEWSNGATTSSINVNQAGIYTVEGSVLMGNIIQNGDFEGGTTANANNFTTSYNVGSGGAWGLLSNPGEYAVSTSPHLVHNNFPVCADHTTGAGNMMIANGASIANTVVWSQTVPVTPNTDYLFSYWAMRVSNDPATSDLQLFINGAAIGPINTTGTLCTWLQVNDNWNSGAATSAILSIVNQSTSSSGNDFALDDISFSPLCIVTDTIEVDIEVISQIITSNDPTCTGLTDGQISIDSPLAVEYSIDGGAWQADSFFVNLAQNTYSICSRSALGCEICEDISLTDPAPVVLTVSNDTTICENGTGYLAANATGGTTFAYHWDFTTDTLAFQTVNPMVLSTYTVFAENENGCLSAPETITVDMFPPLSGTISPSSSICPTETAFLEATVMGGVGAPYTFVWSTGADAVTNGVHSINVTPGATTNYTVTISDGCESTPLVFDTDVTVLPLPVPMYTVTNPDQCEPAVFEIINTTDPAMSQYSYWLIDGQFQYLNQDTIYTPELMAGDYDMQMIITSFDGCVDSTTFVDALHVQPIPTAEFSYSPNPTTMFNTEITFINSSSNANTYQWFFEDGAPATSNSFNQQVLFPDGIVGEYEVTLVVTSELGCSDTVTHTVVVLPEVLIYAPNAFTPDGDEFNQNWRVFIDGIDIYDFNLQLFDRWGELIWNSNNPEESWDGTYNGLPVQTGTYTWVVRTKDLLNDDKYTFNGHVSVLR